MRSGLAILSSALLATAAGAQTLLYDNGSIVTHPGGGAGGLDVSALDNTATFHTPHNVYGFGAQWAAGAGNSLADDFTVCGTWTITEVEVFGYLTNGVPPLITGVYAQVWNGPPNAGGTVVRGDLTTNLVTAPPVGTFNCYRTLIGGLAVTNRQVQTARLPVTWAPLPPGVYWFEFQFTGAAFCPPVSENEVNDTGNGIQRVTATWAVLNNAIAPNTAGCAVPFRLYGTAVGQTVAAAAAYGAGKSGTNGIATWDLGTPVRNPVLGRDYPLRIINGFSGSSPLVFIGTPLANGIAVPPFGTLFVFPVLTTLSMPAFNANNVSSLRLPVPHGPNLCGLVLGWQAFWGDPGATGSVCHTNGLELTLGN
jgi:hypothetical protein